MDTYKVSAIGVDKKGRVVTFSREIHERDSESIPEGEKWLMLEFAAHHHGIKLKPPMTVELVS